MNIKNKIILVLLLCAMAIETAFSASTNSGLEMSPLNLGESLRLHSSILSEERHLNIYLPANYEKSKSKTYPVIYVLDGSTDEDFFHIAGIVQFGSFSWINFIPESIVVGVVNVDRKRDFTSRSSDPVDRKELPSSGGAEKFIEFVESEVQPLINKRYRTNNENTLIGQSLGGLLATQILFESPDLFKNYVIVSPSLWWDKESLLNKPIELSQEKLNIYIAVGGEGSTMVRLATSLADKLNHAYMKRDATSFKYFEHLSHGDALHLAAYEGLKSIFLKKGR